VQAGVEGSEMGLPTGERISGGWRLEKGVEDSGKREGF
jgi:hypothetical protein